MISISKLAVFISALGMTPLPAMAQASPAPSQGPVSVETRRKASRDASFDLPPFPKGKVSLIGGTVVKVDPIHDKAIVRVHGGKDMTIDFDGRTRVVRDEATLSTRDVRAGSRVYLDTILLNGRIFAKTIRIATSTTAGEVKGQVVSYDSLKNLLTIRDERSPQPLQVEVTPQTAIHVGERSVTSSALSEGTLVKIAFRPAPSGAAAEKIDILAQPGNTFTFSGNITFVDVRAGHLAIANQADSTTYEVAIDQLTPQAKLMVKEGAAVNIHTRFDGHGYEAQTIEPIPTPQP